MSKQVHTLRPPRASVRLACLTLAWMLVELGVSAYAAYTAHSAAMLAFASDSVVETLSAATVLMQWTHRIYLSERRAARFNGGLLISLAAAVFILAIASYGFHIEPERTWTGIGITSIAMFAMPVLAFAKRREAMQTGNVAMAADAVQSLTCAYIAAVTLLGLGIRAWFGIARFDTAAALLVVPLLIREGLQSWRGNPCGCY